MLYKTDRSDLNSQNEEIVYVSVLIVARVLCAAIMIASQARFGTLIFDSLTQPDKCVSEGAAVYHLSLFCQLFPLMGRATFRG